MSYPDGPTGWIYSPQSQPPWYRYHPRTDEIEYWGGLRARRPSNVSPADLDRAALQTPQPGSQHSHPHASPPRQPANLGSSSTYNPQTELNSVTPAFSPRPPPQGGRQAPQPPDEVPTGAMGKLTLAQAATPTAQVGYGEKGERIVSAHDPRSDVRLKFITEPVTLTTDPALLVNGMHALRYLVPTSPDDTERLYSTFKIRRSDFFALGRVFLVLWVEPAGENTTTVTNFEQSDDPGITTGRYSERIYSKVRRFVVIRNGHNYCSALPIMTYTNQGVGKPGVVKSEHAIIYTGKFAPLPLSTELPKRKEAGMKFPAIRVVPDEPTDKLDPLSRIDYGRIHTINHNIKVKPFGNVHPDYKAALHSQFGNVWKETQGGADSAIGMAGSSAEAVAGTSSGRDDIGRASQMARDGPRMARSAGSGHSGGATAEDGAAGSSRPSRDSRGADSHRRNTEQERREMLRVAQRTQAEMAERVRRGYTQDQAMDDLVDRLMRSEPSYTRETGMQLIQARLEYGRRPNDG